MDEVNQLLRRLKSMAAATDGTGAAEIEANRQFVSELASALGHKNARVVKRAAALCRQHAVRGLEPALLAAYQRMLSKPQKIDPGCEAKLAILEALRHGDFSETDFYQAAVNYRQIEPVFGGSVDTAAELRAVAAIALVQHAAPQLMRTLVDLLADPEPASRAGAIRAIAFARRPESEPLLRYKSHQGDPRAEVMGECFAGLFALNADEALELVKPKLSAADEETRNEAAIAIGESRHPAAFGVLQETIATTEEVDEIRALSIAIALIRSEQATEFLLAQVRADQPESAVAAIQALKHCRDTDPTIAERLRSAVNGCDNRYIARIFNEEFS